MCNVDQLCSSMGSMIEMTHHSAVRRYGNACSVMAGNSGKANSCGVESARHGCRS